MSNVAQYLLTVIAAAVISGIVMRIMDDKSVFHPIIKLLTGLFLTVTAISPVLNLHFDDLSSYFSDLESEASSIVSEGKEIAAHATGSIIKSQVEAYILDKAASLNLNIDVEVVLSETEPVYPAFIQFNGSVSPYGKQCMEQIVSDELGIPKENQKWT